MERLDHLMHYRRRDSEKPPEICFGRRDAMNLAVVVDKREVLALFGCERRRHVNEPCR
jgi:hypothetical protein